MGLCNLHSCLKSLMGQWFLCLFHFLCLLSWKVDWLVVSFSLTILKEDSEVSMTVTPGFSAARHLEPAGITAFSVEVVFAIVKIICYQSRGLRTNEMKCWLPRPYIEADMEMSGMNKYALIYININNKCNDNYQYIQTITAIVTISKT